jgi:rubredoxin
MPILRLLESAWGALTGSVQKFALLLWLGFLAYGLFTSVELLVDGSLFPGAVLLVLFLGLLVGTWNSSEEVTVTGRDDVFPAESGDESETHDGGTGALYSTYTCESCGKTHHTTMSMGAPSEYTCDRCQHTLDDQEGARWMDIQEEERMEEGEERW